MILGVFIRARIHMHMREHLHVHVYVYVYVNVNVKAIAHFFMLRIVFIDFWVSASNRQCCR